MSNEVLSNPKSRVVRDESQGAYLYQVEVDGVWTTFGGRKLGKIDQLRAQQPSSKSSSKSK